MIRVEDRRGGRERTFRPSEAWFALAFVTAAVATDLNLDVASGVKGTLLANAANLGWLGLSIVLLARASVSRTPRGTRLRLLGHDHAYLGWLGVVGASALWSVSGITTVKAVVPLALVWLAALLLAGLPTAVVVRMVVVIGVCVAVLSLATIPIDTDLAYQPISSTGADELRGIFRHQLRLGAFMSLALGLVIIARFRGEIGLVRSRSTIVNVSIVVLLGTAFVMSRARTYSAAAAAALALTLLLSRRGPRKWVALIVGVVVALAIVAQFDELWIALQDAGFDTTLTGRSDIWARTLRGVTADSHWLGHGFGTLKLPTFDYLYPYNYRAGHAHNSYIQAYFETGVIGLAALLGLIIVQVIVAWRHSVRQNTYSYSLFLVLYTAISSLTGLNYAGTLSAIFAMMMVFLSIESRERTSTRDVEASPDEVDEVRADELAAASASAAST